jgi:hypothetical protein
LVPEAFPSSASPSFQSHTLHTTLPLRRELLPSLCLIFRKICFEYKQTMKEEEQEQHLIVEFRAPHNPHETKMEHNTFHQAVNALDHNVYRNNDPQEAMDMLRTLNRALVQHFHMVGATLLAKRVGVELPPVPDRVEKLLDTISNVFIYGPHAPRTLPPIPAPKLGQVQLFYNTQLRALASLWKCVQDVASSVDVSRFQTFKTDLEAACNTWRQDWKKTVKPFYSARNEVVPEFTDETPEQVVTAWRKLQESSSPLVDHLVQAAGTCATLQQEQDKMEARLFKQYRDKVGVCEEVIGKHAKEALKTLPPLALETLPREFQIVKLLNYVAHVRELLERVPTL